MNKNDTAKAVIANAVIAVITTILMMLILKVSITLGNFTVLFIMAQCQEWGYKNPLTRLVALFS